MKKYDLAILGGGPGGYVAGIYASQLGLKTCVIEKNLVGGTCLNRGCIPTKVMLHAASMLRKLKKCSEFGVHVGSVSFDLPALLHTRDATVHRLRNGIESLFKANKVDLVRGMGTFLSEKALDVDGEQISADNIIVATGSRPLELPALKFSGETVVSSEGALASTTAPASILIVGGGVIGCEFAQFYCAIGRKVTIVELADRILPTLSREISKKMEVLFRKDGVSIRASTKVESINMVKGSVSAMLSDGSVVESERVLVSVGRTPNSDTIGLEKAGVATDRSRIVVNERLETSVAGIWAIGDVINGPMLAHAASYEGILACDNIAGGNRPANFSLIPSCVYTDPGIATVGMSEDEAKKYIPGARTAKFPYRASSKANIMGSIDGHIKIIGGPDRKILGVEIFGEDAYELIGEASLAMSSGLSVDDLAHAVHCHPTLSEMYHDTARLFIGKPIHTVKSKHDT
ncbi:MAG: dihydrolipoyl dehydrogenase [Candidatus Omnitrophota bacterium]